MLHRGSSCSLARAMNDRIMRCGIISSCNQLPLQRLQSAHEHVFIVEQRYIKYRTFTNLPLPLNAAVMRPEIIINPQYLLLL